LFDDDLAKYFQLAASRGRTSNVTTSNGLSSSVIAPSRERLRPARFTGRPARSTRRARRLSAKEKRALSTFGDALNTRTLYEPTRLSGRAVEKIIRGLLHASNKTPAESRSSRRPEKTRGGDVYASMRWSSAPSR